MSTGFERNRKKMRNDSSQYHLENDGKVKGEGKTLPKSKRRSLPRQSHQLKRQGKGDGECDGERDGERKRRRRHQKRVKGNTEPPTREQLKRSNRKLLKNNGRMCIEIFHQKRKIKELQRKIRQMGYNLKQRNETIRDLRDLKSGNSFDGSFFGTLFKE